jgi:hypothetical protein
MKIGPNLATSPYKRFQVATDKDIFEVISPLGLFDTRIRGLREVTERFLYMPLFQIGLQPPLKVYGVGAFTYDSYLIFWYSSLFRLRISLNDPMSRNQGTKASFYFIFGALGHGRLQLRPRQDNAIIRPNVEGLLLMASSPAAAAGTTW